MLKGVKALAILQATRPKYDQALCQIAFKQITRFAIEIKWDTKGRTLFFTGGWFS